MLYGLRRGAYKLSLFVSGGDDRIPTWIVHHIGGTPLVDVVKFIRKYHDFLEFAGVTAETLYEWYLRERRNGQVPEHPYVWQDDSSEGRGIEGASCQGRDDGGGVLCSTAQGPDNHSSVQSLSDFHEGQQEAEEEACLVDRLTG